MKGDYRLPPYAFWDFLVLIEHLATEYSPRGAQHLKTYLKKFEITQFHSQFGSSVNFDSSNNL